MDETATRRIPGRGAQFIALTVIVVIALSAAVLAHEIYLRAVQEPLCRSYAAGHDIDVTSAQLESVTPVSSRFFVRTHTCTFWLPSAETRIVVEFEAEATPYLADTMQVISMVCAFLCAGLIAFLALLALMLRFGYAFPTPRKKPEPPAPISHG